jgi:hypothetical protein
LFCLSRLRLCLIALAGVEHRLRAGETNIPVVFSKVLPLGWLESGGLVGSLNPPTVMWRKGSEFNKARSGGR